MGISMSGSDAFSYNRFDALDEAYRALYEAKEDKEDDVSEKEEDAIKDAVKKHDKEKHSDDDDSDDDKDDSDEESDDDSDDDKDDSDKKFPSFLKKSKDDVKEAVIQYLMDEGFVNNEVSAEVMCDHMNPKWRDEILSETKFDERGRPKSGPFNVYQKGGAKTSSSFDAARERVDAANKAKTPEQRKKELDAYKERQANR